MNNNYYLPDCLSTSLLLLLLFCMIFTVPGVFLSCTLCKSCMLIAANGCCWCCCWCWTATDSSDLVLCKGTFAGLTTSFGSPVLPPTPPPTMLFRYSEGLMCPMSWTPVAGNFGGMNAAGCWGPVIAVANAPPPSEDSPAKYKMWLTDRACFIWWWWQMCAVGG